jgi:hypothetical protein
VTNEVGDTYEFYIRNMIFGSNGTASGVPKFVEADRNGLFGVTELSKPVIASREVTQAIFTTVISFDEAVGVTLNEMALQMETADLYSMVTFPDLNKTAQMQITWNWRLNFI